jgi:ribonuclease HI
MPARRFVCQTCGNEVEFPAAYAEGETPVCCGREMVEFVSERASTPPAKARRDSPPRMSREQSRTVQCPTCGALPNRKCKRDDGSEREASHVQRVRHAHQVMAETVITTRPEVFIYTDGACLGNGGPCPRGGWAAILRLTGRPQTKELSGSEQPSTNQRMEIRSVIEGLKALTRPCTVTVFSDSAYVVNCLNNRWYVNWRRNGWVTTAKKPVANRPLWEELLQLVENGGHTVSFAKVRGHADQLGRRSDEHERYNQRADEVAVAAAAAGAQPPQPEPLRLSNPQTAQGA